MTKNKKILISIIVGLVIVTIVTTGTILGINSINNKNAEKAVVVPTKETAKALRVQAEEARANNDTAKSKELLLESQQQYNELPKTDETANAQADIDSQLFMVEQASKPAIVEPQQ